MGRPRPCGTAICPHLLTALSQVQVGTVSAAEHAELAACMHTLSVCQRVVCMYVCAYANTQVGMYVRMYVCIVHAQAYSLTYINTCIHEHGDCACVHACEILVTMHSTAHPVSTYMHST